MVEGFSSLSGSGCQFGKTVDGYNTQGGVSLTIFWLNNWSPHRNHPRPMSLVRERMSSKQSSFFKTDCKGPKTQVYPAPENLLSLVDKVHQCTFEFEGRCLSLRGVPTE